MLVENFEVLTAKENKFTWEPSSDGKVVAGAISTGREGNDELYIGRAPYQNSMTVGKVRNETLLSRCLQCFEQEFLSFEDSPITSLHLYTL